MARPVEISVLIASRRGGAPLTRCLESLALQRDAPPFEVLVASKEPPPELPGLLAGWVRVEEENPSLRRNRAADFAAGSLLAFIDDDARASPDWLAKASAAPRGASLFGGVDIGEREAPFSERLSDLLLSTPLLGSGVAAHRASPPAGPVRHAADLSSCNLFIPRDVFDRLGGFDETIGFGGEDSDLVRRAIAAGFVPELDPRLVVLHRRPRFPFPYLSRRWSFRLKMGRLMAGGRSGAPTGRIAAFLAAAAALATASAAWGAPVFLPLAALWTLAVLAASSPIWRRDLRLLPAVPAAFFLHHATYALATSAGLLSGLFARPVHRARPNPRNAESPAR